MAERPRVGVVTFPGSNDDRDARRAVELCGADAVPVWHGDAELPALDAVVSAVPFSLMGPAQTSLMLRSAARALRPDGVFVALQYHPRFLAPLLRAEFAVVEREVYLWNIPPAVLLRARGPRSVA